MNAWQPARVSGYGGEQRASTAEMPAQSPTSRGSTRSAGRRHAGTGGTAPVSGSGIQCCAWLGLGLGLGLGLRLGLGLGLR